MQKYSLLAVAALFATARAVAPAAAMPPPLPEVEGKDAATLRTEMDSGQLYEGLLASVYQDRIGRIDDHGPQLNAVIVNLSQTEAYAEGQRLYDERMAGKARGRLHGIPILIKDNIEVAGLPTTAGSLALKGNMTNRDAPIIARLREAGALILGKTNLSEWANIRSDNSTSGWSAIGGLTKNPHALDRNTCGSSSGSAAAVAASLAPLAIGTETDGSITCPAGVNGIVGFKPSLGLVSRTHIVPISHTQDTAGPITLTVRDAAAVMTVIAGSDPADPATAEADARKVDYVAALSAEALKGKRVGVLRDRAGDNVGIAALLDAALKQMTDLGATVVEIADSRKGMEGLGEAEFEILLTDLKADLKTYLSSLPNADGPKTLADVIAFNKANPDELKWFDQGIFELSETKGGLDSPAYLAAREKAARLAGPEGIDRLLKEHGVDLLVGVTNGPAWVSDLKKGDSYNGPSASQLPAVAGYPHLTVPMGAINGLPIGVSFIGPKWSDADVLAAGYAYEQASRKRVAPTYRASAAP